MNEEKMEFDEEYARMDAGLSEKRNPLFDKSALILQGAQEEAVDHPAHYKVGKIEVIEIIEDWDLDYSDGNALKYLLRYPHKHKDDVGKQIEDLRKAQWYIDRKIRLLANEQQREMAEAVRDLEEVVEERGAETKYWRFYLHDVEDPNIVRNDVTNLCVRAFQREGGIQFWQLTDRVEIPGNGYIVAVPKSLLDEFGSLWIVATGDGVYPVHGIVYPDRELSTNNYTMTATEALTEDWENQIEVSQYDYRGYWIRVWWNGKEEPDDKYHCIAEDLDGRQLTGAVYENRKRVTEHMEQWVNEVISRATAKSCMEHSEKLRQRYEHGAGGTTDDSHTARVPDTTADTYPWYTSYMDRAMIVLTTSYMCIDEIRQWAEEFIGLELDDDKLEIIANYIRLAKEGKGDGSSSCP